MPSRATPRAEARYGDASSDPDSHIKGFLGCLRELRGRNPALYANLAALALTGDASMIIAAGDEGARILDGHIHPRLEDSGPGRTPGSQRFERSERIAQTAETDILAREFGGEELRRRTGAPLSPHLALVKLLRIGRGYPSAFSQPGHLFFSLKDYLFYTLTGNSITDPTTASSTGLFNITTGEWERELLDFVGIHPSRIPAVWRAGEGREAPGLAHIHGRWKKELLLKSSLPVVHDLDELSALHLAAGAGGIGDLLISLSGRTCISSIKADLEDRPCRYLLGARGKQYIALIEAQGAGDYVRWAAETFACRTGEIPEGFEKVKIELSSTVTFCPFLSVSEEFHPASRDIPSGMILGLTLGTRGEDILRGVFEGVAFFICQGIHALGCEAAPRVFLRIDARYGERFGALLANLLNREVCLVDRERCTPLAGCALNALERLGVLPAPAIGSRPPEKTHTYAPDPETHALYTRKITKFSSLCRSMERYYKRMSGI